MDRYSQKSTSEPFIKISKIIKSQEGTSFKPIPNYEGFNSLSRKKRIHYFTKSKLKQSPQKHATQKRVNQEAPLKINQSIEYNLSHIEVHQKKKQKAKSLAVINSRHQQIRVLTEEKKKQLEQKVKERRSKCSKKIVIRSFEALSNLKTLKMKAEEYQEQSNEPLFPFMTSIKTKTPIQPVVKLHIPLFSNLIKSENSQFFDYEPRHKEIVKEIVTENLKISENELKLINISEKNRYIDKMKKVRKFN